MRNVWQAAFNQNTSIIRRRIRDRALCPLLGTPVKYCEELKDVSDYYTMNTTEPVMQTTQIPTWCCHQDDDNLNSVDQDDDSVHDSGEQDNTEERLRTYNEFQKPEAVRSRDDLNEMMKRKKMKKLHRIATLYTLYECTVVTQFVRQSVCLMFLFISDK